MEEYDRNITLRYNKDNMTLPEAEFEIFPPCTTALTILIALLLLYLKLYSAFPKDVFKYLAMQHLLVGYLHVLCLTFYQYNLFAPVLNMIIAEVYACLDLVLTYTTSCVAWIIFLRLYLFKDGEELYNIKEITLFSTLFLAILQGYEGLMNVLDDDTFFISVLRFTSILLIMSVPVSVFCLTLICLISTIVQMSVPKSMFSMFHLLLLMSSDILLLKFNFYPKNEPLVWNLLLYCRLVAEVIWYFVYDRFLYSMVF